MNDIVDMSQFVEAKSDQVTADDLLGGPMTITIRKVTGQDGDQPVSIHFDGDNGKPFRPCKTMRRVLLAVWGRNAAEYAGRSMTIYRDDSVTFGGLNVGGIRISHMSHIDKEMLIVVMKTKGKKAGIKIQPLRDAPQASPTQKPDKAAEGVNALLEAIAAGEDVTAHKVMQQREWLAQNRPELSAKIDTALAAREAESGDVADDDAEADQFN